MDKNIIWHIINAKQAWRKRNVRIVGIDYYFSIFNYSNIISRSSSKVSHRNLDLRIVQKFLLTKIHSTFPNSSFCRRRGSNRKIFFFIFLQLPIVPLLMMTTNNKCHEKQVENKFEQKLHILNVRKLSRISTLLFLFFQFLLNLTKQIRTLYRCLSTCF